MTQLSHVLTLMSALQIQTSVTKMRNVSINWVAIVAAAAVDSMEMVSRAM